MGGKERQFAALGVGTFVLHAALNLVLIPIAGATGAAAATALVYVLMALGQIVLNRNYIVGKV
jgi:O-antigen/teichoic acid export membrane protein